jgi:hypothetical protein
VPIAEDLVGIEGLDSLHFNESPIGLEKLQRALSEGGMSYESKQVRYSLLTEQSAKAGWSERTISYVLFGLTSGGGIFPWRPLGILFLGVIPVFFLIDLVLVRTKRGSIQRIWPRGGRSKEDVLTLPGLERFLSIFYFSVLSSFHTKLSDIDPGAWITRMQPRDYILQATGWLRLTSGLQSLLSLYLLALWVLAYVGPEIKKMFE